MTVASLLLLAATLAPQTVSSQPPVSFVEDFQHGREGGWSFFGTPGHPFEVVENAGGNSGAFLHTLCSGFDCLHTYAPMLRTEPGHPRSSTATGAREASTRWASPWRSSTSSSPALAVR